MITGVEPLLQRYGFLPGVALNRILRWVAELDSLLMTGGRGDELVRCLVDNDGRRFTFMLEGILRLYRRRFGRPIDRVHKRVRMVEDGLGALDHATTMLESATTHGFPDTVIVRLRQQQDAQRRALTVMLADKGWEAGGDRAPAVAWMLKTLLKIDWDAPPDDRRWLRREMGRRLDKLDRAEYDVTDLEAGIHELRRQIRWFPIYLFALVTVAVLDDGANPIPEYEPLLRSPIAGSRFSRLPEENIEDDPIRVPRSLFIANSIAVTELGELKDSGQEIEGLARACQDCGLARSHDEAVAMTSQRLGLAADAMREIHDRAAAIYKEIRDLGLVRHLRRAVTGEA